ncbi:signal recognition particle-docking protein FtsY [Actinomyces sp. zg-332]|uniref:signal recognition particle-docking protein FtsY n=1 Tax=Actinomyces sp. zg-332 TaxID=2708340 RepID=UPI001E2E219B|nr:signal recognition particle-docking protein FtsY [Actinomyces sp. zg-332]
MMNSNIVLIVSALVVLVLIIVGVLLYKSKNSNKNALQQQENSSELSPLLEEKSEDIFHSQPHTLPEDSDINPQLDKNAENYSEEYVSVNEAVEQEKEAEELVEENLEEEKQDVPASKEAEKDTKEEVEEEKSVEIQKPESLTSRMTRLRSKLAQSGSFGMTILNLLSKDNISEADWEEIEDTLLMADLGIDSTMALLESLRKRVKVENATSVERVKEILHEELLDLVDPTMDRTLKVENIIDENGNKKPASIIMVGVNGVGKTTTAGKLARILVAEDKSVLLGAADTFRAAASEQLKTWADRTGVGIVTSDKEGADPASVAFDAVKQASESNIDVVIVDTAGRLQNKKDLMDELGKIKRVMSKEVQVSETLLVLDATTGQNGMKQAEVFAQVADVTGIVLTKLDGTAKGGIVVSVQKALGVPVKFVGLGEGMDDLAPFDPQGFVKALLS